MYIIKLDKYKKVNLSKCYMTVSHYKFTDGLYKHLFSLHPLENEKNVYFMPALFFFFKKMWPLGS